MKKSEVLRAWWRILCGYPPSMSIEITRECPLRCPGCYAYEPEHLGDAGPLRSLADFKGQDLVEGVLALVRRHRPMHLSIVGGEPLVRYRELDALLPALRPKFPKVYLRDETLGGFRRPPRTPDECIFARTTVNYTADLRTRIKP